MFDSCINSKINIEGIYCFQTKKKTNIFSYSVVMVLNIDER